MNRCHFCNSESLRDFQAEEKMLGLGEQFTYQECQDCQSLQIKSVPSDISAFYKSDTYYSFSSLVTSSSLKNFLKKVRMWLFLKTGASAFSPSYGYWLRELNPAYSDRIVDIGCGSGQLLYELWASGFENLTGVDPFLDSSKDLEPGLSLIKGGLEDLPGEFDIMLMHHAFEHMAEPKKTLETCRQKLKKDGRLLIRTPLAGSSAWEEFGDNWVQLDAPRHLNIPSLEGFKKLVNDQGLKLEKILFDSTAFQFWGSILYQRGIKLAGTNCEAHFSSNELREFQKKALRYNQEGKGDQVCFYLRRAD
ncbi:class I SAM-dependent methyltransferase [uncultured Algoriphagus sp.]|jgi:SAM-dependent methyltransferase|uniref:class I SAM-dependent methyltransferase n=1 Tax=uncultured Algoriphagus sp. TaxID=417365 RepID=UPI0010648E50|nr:class I SAM-dependent methyltransferase [uncultured Algoriphagus sp.]